METNLVQIPVLVLTPALKKLSSPIASNRFSISFNNDPPFRPRYTRIEGDDPIHLAIVLGRVHTNLNASTISAK